MVIDDSSQFTHSNEYITLRPLCISIPKTIPIANTGESQSLKRQEMFTQLEGGHRFVSF